MSNLQRNTTKLYKIETFLRSKDIPTGTRKVSDLTAEFLKSKGLKYQTFNPKYKGLFTAALVNAPDVFEYFEEFKTFITNKLDN